MQTLVHFYFIRLLYHHQIHWYIKLWTGRLKWQTWNWQTKNLSKLVCHFQVCHFPRPLWTTGA